MLKHGVTSFATSLVLDVPLWSSLKPDKDLLDSKARDIRNSIAELLRLTSKIFVLITLSYLMKLVKWRITRLLIS
jgi:hypothetical protein